MTALGGSGKRVPWLSTYLSTYLLCYRHCDTPMANLWCAPDLTGRSIGETPFPLSRDPTVS